MSTTEYDAAIAAFIRSKGITRCPTACLAPTQGSAGAADRMALRQWEEQREAKREERVRTAQMRATRAA